MKNRNWFWGVFFILAAIFVVASQTTAFGQFGFWSILATVLLIALMVKSIMSHSFFGIFLPLALLYMIYQNPLNFVEISFWLLILSAILLSIGCNMIFRFNSKKVYCMHAKQHGKHEHFNQTIENIDDNNPLVKVSFGSSSKYLHADCLTSGQFTVSFGELAIYFDQVQLNPDGAEIFIDCSLGALNLYVPKHWRVIENLHTGLAGVTNDTRFTQPAEDAPRLTITGNVQLGALEIHYV